jgi:hypothetical protein
MASFSSLSNPKRTNHDAQASPIGQRGLLPSLPLPPTAAEKMEFGRDLDGIGNLVHSIKLREIDPLAPDLSYEERELSNFIHRKNNSSFNQIEGD